jgi:hypothetical protein
MAFIVVSALLLNLDIGLFRADATASRAGDYCPIFLVPETIYLRLKPRLLIILFNLVDSYTNGSLRAPTLDIQNILLMVGMAMRQSNTATLF